MPNVAQNPDRKPMYAAFMSYSHAADGKLAPCLQRAVQRLGKPWYRRSSTRVFRDETSLSANPGLWSAIQAALEQCQYFLLMCSPTAAASPWVQKEVEWWLANRPANRLLLVITDGDVAWDSAACDFDWSRTTSLPRLLAHRFSEEPYYIDLRWAHNQDTLSLRNVRFRTATLTIAATLQGKPMEEIESEDLRQQRHLRTAVLCTAIVILLLMFLTFTSRQSSRLAGRTAALANRTADSRRMAAKATSILAEHGDLHEAILVGVLAWRLAPTDEARDVLTQLESASTDVARILGQHSTDGVEAEAFTVAPDGSPLLVTGDYHGTLMFWRVPGGDPVGPPLATGHDRNQQLLFSADGSSMLSVAGSAKKPGSLTFWDLRSRNDRAFDPALMVSNADTELWPGRVALSPSGHVAAFYLNDYTMAGYRSTQHRKLALWDTASGALTMRELALPSDLLAITFLDEGHLLLVLAPPNNDLRFPGDRGNGLRAAIWTQSTNQLEFGARTIEDRERSTANSVLFSADGARIAVFRAPGEEPALYQRDGLTALRLIGLPEAVRTASEVDLSLSGNGTRLAASSNEHVYIWDATRSTMLKTLEATHHGVLSQDGRWLAARPAGMSENITIWDLNRAGGAPANVSASCNPNDGNACLQKLCEKATPLLNSDDAELRRLLGEMETERLKHIALSRPCKRDQTELWTTPDS